MNDEETNQTTIMGVAFGTHASWDGDMDDDVYLSFVPNELWTSLGMTPCDSMTVNLETGETEGFDAEGTTLFTVSANLSPPEAP